MQTLWILLLSFPLHAGEQPDPLLSRTIMVRGKEKLQFRHTINKHPRTGVVTEVIAWNSFEMRTAAYLRFYMQLSFPAFKAESSEERETIQKAVVLQFLQKQIPLGTSVEKAEACLLDNGFNSIRHSNGQQLNTINFYGNETVKNGLFDWNRLFVASVDIRFDADRKVTEISIRRAVYTYPHKGA
jgi:hypothetical protein